MLRFLNQALQLIDKALEAPAARARLKKNQLWTEGRKVFYIPELDVVVPGDVANRIDHELARQLEKGRQLREDLRQAGIDP